MSTFHIRRAKEEALKALDAKCLQSRHAHERLAREYHRMAFEIGISPIAPTG